MQLNYLKEEQELAIKRNVRELMYSLHPSMMFKNLLNKFTGNEETKVDLKTIGLNLGKDFLISKVFGRGGSIKGFISSLLVRKATDYVMKNYPDTLANGIHKIEDYFKNRKNKSAE